MFDSATVTIAGNVVADPKITGLPDDPSRVNFRVVSTHRRRDPESGQWIDAGEYGVNVVCWRNLARGVAQSLHRGEPVLVIGRIAERPYQADDGTRRYFTEVTAEFVGHDLAKGVSKYYRFSRLSRLDEPGGQRDPGADEPGDAAARASAEVIDASVAAGPAGAEAPLGGGFDGGGFDTAGFPGEPADVLAGV